MADRSNTPPGPLTLRTDDERSIADPICDLGQLPEERGFDFVSEIRRVIRHWFAELHAQDGNLNNAYRLR
jgi:hypothetical protein